MPSFPTMGIKSGAFRAVGIPAMFGRLPSLFRTPNLRPISSYIPGLSFLSSSPPSRVITLVPLAKVKSFGVQVAPRIRPTATDD
jgi:hypothetical protein